MQRGTLEDSPLLFAQNSRNYLTAERLPTSDSDLEQVTSDDQHSPEEQRSPLKEAVCYSAPLVLTNLIETGISFTEGLFYAKLGDDAVSTSALIDTATDLWTTLSSFLGAIDGFFSTENVQGVDHHHQVGSIVQSAWLLGLIISIPTMACTYFASGPTLRLFGQDENLISSTYNYLVPYTFSIPALMNLIVDISFLASTSRQKSLALIMFLSSSLGLLCRYLFMFGLGSIPQLGIAGAGIAMLIETWAAWLTFKLYFQLSKDFRHYHFFHFDYSRLSEMRNILKKGSPLFFADIIINASSFLMLMILGHIDSKWLALNQVVSLYLSWCDPLLDGINRSTGILVGQSFGFRNYNRMQQYTKTGFLLSSVVLVFPLIVFLAAPEQVTTFFIDANEYSPSTLRSVFVGSTIAKLVENATNVLSASLLNIGQTNSLSMATIFGGLLALLSAFLLGEIAGLNLLGINLGLMIGYTASTFINYMSWKIKSAQIIDSAPRHVPHLGLPTANRRIKSHSNDEKFSINSEPDEDSYAPGKNMH